MSEHSLPEDYSHWPADPYELLGVVQGIDPKELKRAYTRLIKLYKPEHHPEQFRRIREAYESALRYNEFFGQFRIVVPSEQPADLPEIRPAECASNLAPSPSAPIVDKQAPSPLIPDEVDRLWELAIHGEEAEAYRGLLLLHEARPYQATIILQLYWLLSLDPKLDPETQPCDWLAAGLKACGPHHALIELYRREIEAEPSEAFWPRFSELLGCELLRPALPELYAWRFYAIRKFKRWDLLNDDLPIARERLFGHDESTWLRLLLLVCDAAAWIQTPEQPFGPADQPCNLWERVYREVQARSHLARQHSAWFNRLDYLAALRENWHKFSILADANAIFFDLIADSWNAPYRDFQPVLMQVLNQINNFTERWLEYFDQLLLGRPIFMDYFAEVLQQYESRLENPPPQPSAQTLERLGRQYLDSLHRNIEDHRMWIIEFCELECIDLDWLVDTSQSQTSEWRVEYDPSSVLNSLANDLPVRLICKARLLFRC